MSGQQLILGTRKGILIFERRDKSWELVREGHVGAQVTYAAVDPRNGRLYACLQHGHWGPKLHCSEDQGKTWRELPVPKYPEGTEYKPGKPATLNYQWCLAFGSAQQPGRLYLGTVPGGLFQSDDGGENFQLVESLWNHPSRSEQWFGGGMNEPGIHSILVDPRNHDRIAVGVSVAGVFLSEDGGKTWHPRNKGLSAEFLPNPDVEVGHDPHLVVQCESQPDILWQQNHCGIFMTRDGGANWKAVSKKGETAHFGFAVAVDPEDGNRAWVVPAESDEVRVAVNRRLCVCQTEDGGETWQVLGSGLPQKDCYDFVFRHSLDLEANCLAMGTVGGSLHISEDRGCSWGTVSTQLPPIYSLRFA
ncbi:MAG: exo-alpha-sialidase [Planctomycetales bacterium]